MTDHKDDKPGAASQPRVVKGDQDFTLDRETFRARFLDRFNDAMYQDVAEELEKVFEITWQNYMGYRKSPRTEKAGPEFAEPERHLPVEWLETRRSIKQAQARHDDTNSPSRILVINGSARSDQTCPGEVSKTYRLAKIARETIAALKGYEVDFLDLSRLTGEAQLVIYPCKACVSTAQPLCHWPCTCYPNHALRQTGDWMHEIDTQWIAAHGVMILTPVNWYQAPSVLKLMMDRLVCADGGNPDPTTTRGKNPEKAKALELAGWAYPRHLADRRFAIVVHGDTEGAETLRRSLTDWLTDMALVP